MLEQRKREHLDICLKQGVNSSIANGFERYRFTHNALPELDLDQVQLSTSFLGHTLEAPLLISAMTGGTRDAAVLNARLAQAANKFGIAMGVGSQRAAIANPALLETYQVRRYAPDIMLLANLGAVQLNNGYDLAECQQAVASIDADALVLHLNPLQEALQSDGNTNFSQLLDKIHGICSALPVPVIVKEIGYGLSPQTAEYLLEAGVAALDIAGAGGTSWSEVERLRSADSARAQIASGFRGWGIPTAEALNTLHRAFPQALLIASGGIRDGIEVAKALSLGASLAGIARPLLIAAHSSQDELEAALQVIIEQLRISMFCTGSRTLGELQNSITAVSD
ncbi:MAG: type 2 isopentenyl-diphosphate Delta-isomerase [Chloroflexi bacterium]|nr:type 2 isopentenyl-diphosphate Delta-isomerase [Chloroflexota bacterium]